MIIVVSYSKAFLSNISLGLIYTSKILAITEAKVIEGRRSILAQTSRCPHECSGKWKNAIFKWMLKAFWSILWYGIYTQYNFKFINDFEEITATVRNYITKWFYAHCKILFGFPIKCDPINTSKILANNKSKRYHFGSNIEKSSWSQRKMKKCNFKWMLKAFWFILWHFYTMQFQIH